jgi:hypothetical protein
MGWNVGVTAEDLVGAQCRAVVGLGRAKDDERGAPVRLRAVGVRLLFSRQVSETRRAVASQQS